MQFKCALACKTHFAISHDHADQVDILQIARLDALDDSTCERRNINACKCRECRQQRFDLAFQRPQQHFTSLGNCLFRFKLLLRMFLCVKNAVQKSSLSYRHMIRLK